MQIQRDKLNSHTVFIALETDPLSELQAETLKKTHLFSEIDRLNSSLYEAFQGRTLPIQ